MNDPVVTSWVSACRRVIPSAAMACSLDLSWCDRLTTAACLGPQLQTARCKRACERSMSCILLSVMKHLMGSRMTTAHHAREQASINLLISIIKWWSPRLQVALAFLVEYLIAN